MIVVPNIMSLYNEGHSIKYIIANKHDWYKMAKKLKIIDRIPTKKTIAENVYKCIYDNLIKEKAKEQPK